MANYPLPDPRMENPVLLLPGAYPVGDFISIDPAEYERFLLPVLSGINGHKLINNSAQLRPDFIDFTAAETYLESVDNFIPSSAALSYGFTLTTSQTGVNKHIVNIGLPTTHNMSHAILNNNVLKFGAWGADVLGSVIINDGAPHRIWVVYDGAKYVNYVDGQVDTVGGAYSALNISAASLHIGHYRGGGAAFALNGRLSDVRFINRALTADEIRREFLHQYADLLPL